MNINSKRDWEILEEGFVRSKYLFFCDYSTDFEKSWNNYDFQRDLKLKASQFLEIHSEWSSLCKVVPDSLALFYLHSNNKPYSYNADLCKSVRLAFIRWMIRHTK